MNTETKQRKLRRGITRKRWVSVIMSDSYHKLQLVGIKLPVMYLAESDGYEISNQKAEAEARKTMEAAGLDPDLYDYVGTLVAHLGGMVNRGLIIWGEEPKNG